MGKPGQMTTGGGGGGSTTGGGGTADLSSLLAELQVISQQLQDIQNELHVEVDAGQLTAQIDFFNTLTNANAINPYPAKKWVKVGYFQNLSATDEITVVSTSTGTVNRATAGKGYVMNRAALAGQGGGTFTFANVDLSQFSVITNNNTGQTMASVFWY